MIGERNSIRYILMIQSRCLDPMYFSNAEIASNPVAIIGKVRELRAKF
jgi:hypothetical protein